MKITAIIQARMGSSRLPGKVMKVLADKTVLGHVISRVASANKNIDIIVATSNLPQDQIIVQEAKKHGAQTFCGSEQDVLARYYFAAQQANANLVVRITSDCPLYDGKLLAQMLDYYEGEDYLSNVHQRSFPRGLDTEIFTFNALEKAHFNAILPPEREHVTPYIHTHPEIFRIRHFSSAQNNSGYRWTLDTPEDWQMISSVYEYLYNGNIFTTQQVLDFLSKNPHIAAINAHIEQKKC